MLIKRAFDEPRAVVDISFRGYNGILSLYDDYPDMIVLPVFKDTIVKNNITGFGHKAISDFMIPYTLITRRKFFPSDTARQMTGGAFIRTNGYIKARFLAAIIHE